MHALRTSAVFAAVISTSLAGCFYLSSINERPRPNIAEDPRNSPYSIGREASFSALGSRDDQAASKLKATWSALTCDSNGCTEFDSEVRFQIGSLFLVTPPAKGTLRIVLTLTDESGASEKTTRDYDVVNREPTIDVQIPPKFPDPGPLGGHVLGLPIELAVAVSDPDGDDVTLTWNYEAPTGAGSNPDNVTFEPVEGSETLRELIGDVAGVWEVAVTADDGDDGVASATKQVVFAPDGPPCVGALAPAATGGDVVFVSGEPKTFSVLSVVDALDPWPELRDSHPQIGRATFTWSIASAASGGIYIPLPNYNRPELVINPSEHSPGDRISVRAELADRLAQSVACPAAEPTCSADDNTCSQRMTWEVEIR